MISQSREGAIPASWAWKKIMRFVVIFLAVAGFAAMLWPSHPSAALIRPGSNITVASSVRCDPDVDILERLEIKKLLKYTRREIVAQLTSDPLPITQYLDEPFLEVTTKAPTPSPDETNPEIDGCTIPIPVTLQVPRPPKLPDASHIAFGVATTASRLNESLDQFAHWAGYTRTRIYASIEPEDDEGVVESVRAKADLLGINLHIKVEEDNYLNRYFSLITLLEENMREDTQWGCIIDDDTFFPSMPALVNALAEYDHTKSMYIGSVSEGIPQIAVFGMIAFGGAGVFLSRPLLTELTAVYDICERMTFTGDRRIANCIYQYTSTRLTVDHRLHQLDLMKDASGFFESGRELPLSVHHWKSWFQADIPKMSVISELCGPDCLLRQFKFNDEWILTNGFSVIKYGYAPPPGDLSMEMTWEPHNGANTESYLHELGPLRMKDEEKVSYLLADSVVEPSGAVKQWYVKRDSKGDEVLELSWRKQS
ncbi:hypothetical protein N7540_012279 [Penicillium herquei]|nr:hypothetical protein N7540_012279 [Penicillium herquei]